MAVSWLVSVTVAFGTAAPDGSCTVPRTSAVSNWAKSAVPIRKQPRNSVVFKSLFTSLTSNRFSQADIDRCLHPNYRCVTVAELRPGAARKRLALTPRFSYGPSFEAGRGLGGRALLGASGARFQFPRQREQQYPQKSGNQDAVKRGVPSVTLGQAPNALAMARGASDRKNS